jgi:hypothetical protein
VIRDEAAARGPIARGMIIIKEGRRMARALQRLGVEVYEGAHSSIGDQLFYTTAEGVDVIKMLLRLTPVSTKWVYVARRFARKPEVFGEYKAAYNLDADDEILRVIYKQVWETARAKRRRATRGA